jgi:hypothetical protein
MKVITILILYSFMLVNHAYAQAPVCSWMKTTVGTDNEAGSAVATDKSGNVYVVGYFSSSSIVFGTTTLTNAGTNADFFIVKYNNTGIVQWAKAAGGSGWDGAVDIICDTTGNVYVTGYFNSPAIVFGTTTLTNAGTSTTGDIFILKYDANGNVLWADTGGGNGGGGGNGICIDKGGNVIVTGSFYSPALTPTTMITFGTFSLTNTSGQTIFIVKYDPAGNVIWANSPSPGMVMANDVSTDAIGNIFVTGWFYGSPVVFGTSTLTNAGTSDAFLLKCDASGNTLWCRSLGGNYEDYGNGISTDMVGNVYVTGTFSSSSLAFATTTLTNGTSNNYAYFIAKYDSSGNVVWAKSTSTPAAGDGSGISTDMSGNIYVTGQFQGLYFPLGTATLANSGTSNAFVVSYDPAGSVLWAISSGGSGFQAGYSICNDKVGNVYITGVYSQGSLACGGSTLVNTSVYHDFFVTKLGGIPLGIGEPGTVHRSYEIFPNPVNDKLRVVGENDEQVNLTLYSSLGEIVIEKYDFKIAKDFEMSSLPRGIYFLKIERAGVNGNITKVIKE